MCFPRAYAPLRSGLQLTSQLDHLVNASCLGDLIKTRKRSVLQHTASLCSVRLSGDPSETYSPRYCMIQRSTGGSGRSQTELRWPARCCCSPLHGLRLDKRLKCPLGGCNAAARHRGSKNSWDFGSYYPSKEQCFWRRGGDQSWERAGNRFEVVNARQLGVRVVLCGKNSEVANVAASPLPPPSSTATSPATGRSPMPRRAAMHAARRRPTGRWAAADDNRAHHHRLGDDNPGPSDDDGPGCDIDGTGPVVLAWG
ncbi:hypothetical protein GE09DRAFT_305143 [Coniochaeta sp. 2T2.1]|nr:hypothetical protein GE09DRAFT_305143 [Coniochaeta sp. 2T2.1]